MLFDSRVKCEYTLKWNFLYRLNFFIRSKGKLQFNNNLLTFVVGLKLIFTKENILKFIFFRNESSLNSHTYQKKFAIVAVLITDWIKEFAGEIIGYFEP